MKTTNLKSKIFIIVCVLAIIPITLLFMNWNSLKYHLINPPIKLAVKQSINRVSIRKTMIEPYKTEYDSLIEISSRLERKWNDTTLSDDTVAYVKKLYMRQHYLDFSDTTLYELRTILYNKGSQDPGLIEYNEIFGNFEEIKNIKCIEYNLMFNKIVSQTAKMEEEYYAKIKIKKELKILNDKDCKK